MSVLHPSKPVAEAVELTSSATPVARKPIGQQAERQGAARQIHRSLKAWRDEDKAEAPEAAAPAEAAKAGETAGGESAGATTEADGEEEEAKEAPRVAAKHKSSGGVVARKIFRYSEYQDYVNYAREQDPNYAMEQDKPMAEQLSAEILALPSPPDLAALLKFDALKKHPQWPIVSDTCKSLEPVKAAQQKLTELSTQYADLGAQAMGSLIAAVAGIVKPPSNAPPGGLSPTDQLRALKQDEKYKLWLNATALGSLPTVAAKVSEAKATISAKELELSTPAAGAAPAPNADALDPKEELEKQKEDIITVLEGMAAELQLEGMTADIWASGLALGLGIFLGPLAGLAAGIGAGIFSLLQGRKERKLQAELKELVERVKESNDKDAIAAVIAELTKEVGDYEMLKAQLTAKIAAAKPAPPPGGMGKAEKVESLAHSGHVVLEGVAVASHHFHEIAHNFLPGLGGLILAFKAILHGRHVPHLNEKVEEKESVERRLRGES